MAKPTWATHLTNLKGPKGDKGRPGTFDSITTVTMNYGDTAYAVISGDEGEHLELHLPRGLPGTEGVPTAEAIALNLAPDMPAGEVLSERMIERSTLSVMDFGAVGDGVADDTAAVQDAVAATVGGQLHWPDGTYLVAASIPDIHLVKHSGDGVLDASGTTFRPAPVRGVTNTIYVSPAGLDTNDGLSAAFPMREIRTAVEAIANYATPLRGSWVVNAAAGSYKGGIDLTLIERGASQNDFVRIVGPDVGGHPNVPTAIIDLAEDATVVYGVRAYDGAFLRMENVKFLGTFGYAIDTRRSAYAVLTNVHGDGVDGTGVFFGALTHVRYSAAGGIVENYSTGFQEHFACVRSFDVATSSGEATIVRDCGTAVRAKEDCSGHLDYMIVQDCEVGVELHAHTTANVKAMTFQRNGVAVVLVNSEVHNEGGVVWGSGADVNTRRIVSLGSSHELQYAGWTGTNQATIATAHRPLQLLAADYTDKAQTGSTSEMTAWVFSGRLLGGMYQVKGKRFEVVVVGSVAVSPSTSTGVRVVLRVGGDLCVEVPVPQSAPVGADFEVKFTVVCTADGNNQKAWASVSGFAAGLSAYAPRTIDLAPNFGIQVSTIAGASGDSVTLRACEVWG